MCVGSCVSSTIWVKICAWAQSIIGKEIEDEIKKDLINLREKNDLTGIKFLETL